MTQHILLGSLLMLATTLVHSGCTVIVVRVLGNPRVDHLARRSIGARIWLIAALVLMLFLAALVEVAIWATTYVWAGAFAAAEPALYFSMVTFTSLGYGDVVLAQDWRLLASFEAANGIIMFGWTTALIVAFVHRFVSYAHAHD